MLGTVRSPRQVLLGEETVVTVGPLAAELGRRVLLVSDEVISQQPGYGQARESLEHAGLEVTAFLDSVAEVPLSSIAAGRDAAHAAEADVIVALGGGSVIDLAKAVATLVAHGGEPADYYGESKVPGPTVPVIALPTTSGTGSEVTPVAVVSDPGRELKVGISSVHLVPTYAICDPLLTLSCPPSVTAHAGVDALCHAVESYTDKARDRQPLDLVHGVSAGKNPISDELALRAVRQLSGSLVDVVEDGSDRVARGEVMQAATQAGLAFAHAGAACPHALQLTFGVDTKTPHGLGVGLMLPYVLTEIRTLAAEELADLAACVGVDPSLPVDEAGEAFITWVVDLNQRIGIPASLADIGLVRDTIPDVARRTSTAGRLLQNHRGPTDVASLERILDAAWQGRRELLAA